MDLHLDFDAIGEILKVTCAPAINELAGKVAANAAGDSNLPDGATVTVKQFTTDRAVAVVRLNHPASAALQAKYGILTRAAAAAGLEVKAK
jgi:hypothetical protein